MAVKSTHGKRSKNGVFPWGLVGLAGVFIRKNTRNLERDWMYKGCNRRRFALFNAWKMYYYNLLHIKTLGLGSPTSQ